VGGGKGSNTTKSTFKLPPEFIKAYSESLGLAREAIQKPYTPYTGQLVAGLTPGQQQGISNIQSAQGMAQPFIQEGAGLTREAARGITPELYDRFYSPYVRDVANATQANLLESGAQQRSGLKGGAIQAGAFGGDRSGIAQAEMSRQQQLANAQAMSNIYNQGYGQAMGLANNQVQNLGAMGNQLAGMGTTAQTSALQGAQAQLAAGAQEQTTNQAGLQAAYDQFLQQQSYPFQIAQYFANIAQGLGSTAGGTSATTAPGPSAASQIMGGIGALGSIASMASDERVKENIEAVGTLNDGQTVYRYNFKGDPKTQIGLLAQEVEQRNPGAVSEVKGLKMVDYRDATEDAASSMGGVVGPDSDRQGFMNGGAPYGGVGFVPNNPMQTGATSKIPDAVATQPDAGLAGSAATADPFSDQQKKGFANIGNMFAKPSVYNSGGVVGRNAYAEGGVPFIPYSGGSSFIPEGKIGGGGSAIPSEPDAYVDKGLAEDWQSIKPFTEEQQAGLEAISGKVRGMFADPDMAAAGYTGGPSVYEMGNPQFDTTAMPTDFNYKFASGGVAGRNGYQYGGEPTMEDAMAEAEAMRETQGLGGGEYPRLLNKESGNNYGARNKQGYVGRGQFGDARLEDARRAGVLPEGMDKEAFRRDPNTQQAVEKWHFSDINDFIDKRGLGAFEGKTVGGVPVTREGLVNVAHLGGKGGMEKFITSGGVYNPTDANGTRLSDYLAMGAQSGGVGAASAPAGYSDDQIVPTAAEGAPEGVAAAEKTEGPFSLKNLFASETNPSIIESIIGRRMSPEARNAVLNASFALMAGKSPFFMTNIGEAGKVGTQTYYNALQQKRELAKQQADIARQGFEAQTGRMTAETQRLSAARQLYAEMLPQIRFWQMRNPGQSLPPEFQRVIDAAYPPEGPAGLVAAPGQAPALAGAAPAAGGALVPETGTAPAPEAGGAIPPPSSEGIASPPAGAASGSAELDKLYAQLPDEMNPNYWMSMAENAMTASDYTSAAQRAAELTAQYQKEGIPLPSGVVSFPGMSEKQARQKRVELGAEQAGKSVNQIYTDLVSAPQQNYAQTYNSLQQASDVLQNFESGSLATVKGQIAGLMQSLGLPVDQKNLENAADVEKLQKIFIGGLLNSGLREKFGTVAVGELDLAMKSTGSPNTQPSANRSIVGTMKGVMDWQRGRAEALAKFIQSNGGLNAVDPIALQEYASTWDKELPKYVENAIANTPVKGDIDWSSPEARKRVKVGRKYILPSGEIVKYTGGNDFEFVE
jgi:hypothetical protein